MRAIAVVAWVGLISCASSRPAVTPVRAASVARDAGAPIRWNPGQSTAFDHGDWVAGHESDPWVVERRDARTRLIDTTIRAEIAEDGTITVARQRPRRHIAEVFATRDGRWIFVTTDGLVLSAPSFLGDFSTRAELSARLNTARRRAQRTPAIVTTNDHALWALDDPAAPRRVRDPALTEVIDAAFVDERRAIAITTPGRLWLSSDAGRSFQSLDSPEGVPLELSRSGDSSLRIRTTGAWWRVTNDGRVREAPDESDESNTPARLDASESNRWRQWRERALWPFGTLTMGPVVNDAAITGDPETEQLVLRRRSGETFPITVELNDPRASRFGTSIAIRNTDGAITLLDTTTGHPRRLPRAPNANPSHYAVFADDGSVIANIQPDMQHLDYWTPEGDWRSTTLAEPVTIAHARAQKIYGTTEDGIVEISLQADGAASIRSIARFSALGRPRAGLETYESSSQDNSTRAWLYRSNGGHSCVVIVEDGTAASTIDLPASNADCTAVHFVDARFGVVAGSDGVAVTRDGRTWQRVDTSTVRVDQPLFYPLFLWQFVRAIDRDSIFVFPGHRITREAPSTPPVVYRSSPLPESEPDNEQGEQQQHARCTVRQRQQSAQVQREVERTGDVAIARVSTDRQSIELRDGFKTHPLSARRRMMQLARVRNA